MLPSVRVLASPPHNRPSHELINAGITPTRRVLDELLADRPGDRRGHTVNSRAAPFETPIDSATDNDRGITFPMFLTMMGEHLYDFDAETELLAAFECFDESDSGLVKCDEIRKWLGDVGERMDESEVRFVIWMFSFKCGVGC